MIFAKSNGLMVRSTLIEETDARWRIQCCDEKFPKWVDKDDDRRQVFETVAQAEAWIDGEDQ